MTRLETLEEARRQRAKQARRLGCVGLVLGSLFVVAMVSAFGAFIAACWKYILS